MADSYSLELMEELGEWQDRDIDDPYRQPIAAFENALAEIQEGVAAWVEKIKA